MTARIEYLGNAGVYENARRDAEAEAKRREAAGDADGAAEWRAMAERSRQLRDNEQRREEDRRFRARVFRRRY